MITLIGLEKSNLLSSRVARYCTVLLAAAGWWLLLMTDDSVGSHHTLQSQH